jgi:phosphoenolpyruvate carboxylase
MITATRPPDGAAGGGSVREVGKGRIRTTLANMPTTPPSRVHARFEVPAPLRADVRLLGELLGRVLEEYGGPTLLADVERLRELTIAAHHDDPVTAEEAATASEDLVASWDLERAENVARAFTCYFHLTNLAEEYQRVRALRAYDTGDRPVRDSPPGRGLGDPAHLGPALGA